MDNTSNESSQLRVKLRAVASAVTSAVAGTVLIQTLTLTANRLNSITPPKRQRDGSPSLAGIHGAAPQSPRARDTSRPMRFAS